MASTAYVQARDRMGDGNWVMAAVDRYQKPLLGFATRMVGPNRAQDVVQETFLELCKQKPQRLQQGLAAWLFTVSRNKCFDVLRRKDPTTPWPEEDNMRTPDSGPHLKLERKQSLSQLMRAVERLKHREREAVLLKFAAGLSYKEIAEVMKLSVSNVGFILHHALRDIREHVAEESVVERSAQ